LTQQQKYFDMNKFASEMWGSMNIGGFKVEKTAEEIAEEAKVAAQKKIDDDAAEEAASKKVDTEEDEDDEEAIKAKAVEDAKEGKEDPAKKGKKEDEEEDEEIEFTEDDVNKAYTMLDEEGVLELTDEDEFEAGPKGLADAVAVTVQRKLKAEIAKIPAPVQEFYSHIVNGGKPGEFVYSDNSIDYDKIDLDIEANQELVLKQHLVNQGLEPAEAQEEIDDSKASGKLETKSRRAIGILQKIDSAKKVADAKAIKDAEKADADRAKADRAALEKEIDEATEIAGFALNDKNRKKFKSYIYDVNPRTGKTQMQENMQNTSRIQRIAFMDFLDFNKEDFTKSIKTEVTKKRKKTLTRWSDKNVKNAAATASVTTKQNVNKGKIKIPDMWAQGSGEVED
jgi:hypothetical protein